MKVKEESEKAGLKLNIQKTKIMASGPITSLQVDRETIQTGRLCFGAQKKKYGSYCSHELKRCLLFESKAMATLNSILKSKDISLPTKLYLVKTMVFSQ